MGCLRDHKCRIILSRLTKWQNFFAFFFNKYLVSPKKSSTFVASKEKKMHTY